MLEFIHYQLELALDHLDQALPMNDDLKNFQFWLPFPLHILYILIGWHK